MFRNKNKINYMRWDIFKNFEFLEKLAKYKLVKVLFKKFQIEHYLNKTKVFIGSAGSSIYEMSYLNTPSIF